MPDHLVHLLLHNGQHNRGAEEVEKAATSTARPNLYAVLIGVSDYQGTDLDLKYAAKDAQDLAEAVGNTARKMLTDGHAHVYVYRLTTGKGRDQLPEKARIQQVFVDIGRQATANDIVLLFMAGHGLVAGKQEQFCFLTAEASLTAAAQAVATVSVSTQELRTGLQPSRVRAQKRVLILDTCNSGQVINDLVKIGQPAGRGSEAVITSSRTNADQTGAHGPGVIPDATPGHTGSGYPCRPGQPV